MVRVLASFSKMLVQNLHLIHVLEDKLLGKYVVKTPKKSILKLLLRNFCLSKYVFQETACPKQVGRVLAKAVVDYSYLLDLFTGVLLAAGYFQHTDTGQYNSVQLYSIHTVLCMVSYTCNESIHGMPWKPQVMYSTVVSNLQVQAANPSWMG